MPSLTLAEAEALVADALCRCRTSEENAALVARAMVRAEAEGLKNHGLLRVPIYSAQARVGKVDGFAEPAVERLQVVFAIDAQHGFASPAMDQAADMLVPLARECARIPGARRLALRAKAEREGLQISGSLLAAIRLSHGK